MTKNDDATAALRSGLRYRIVGCDYEYDYSGSDARRVPTVWVDQTFTYRSFEDRSFYDRQPHEIGALWLTEEGDEPPYIVSHDGTIKEWSGFGTRARTLDLEIVDE